MSEKKKKWIQKAVPKENEGKFTEKARAAGMSVGAFANKEKNAAGTLGKEARLAKTFEGFHRKKSPLYTNPRSHK